MDDFSIWTKVVTHPLGLGGFGMFLVFVLLSKVVKRGSNQTITLRVFLSLATVSLVGGLMIAWEQVKSTEITKLSKGAQTGNVEISGNSGNVEVKGINTKVNIQAAQPECSNVGNVGIKNNKGKVQAGNINTEVKLINARPECSSVGNSEIKK